MALSTISGTTGITDATVTSAKLADFTAAVDLNGVELLLDADADTSISADTDDQIDIKIANADHLKILSSSGDTVLKPMVDAKDIIFQQFDGNKVFEINDGNYVGVGGNATAAGAIRIYEDTDNGSHYSGFTVGNLTASVTYALPNADGSSGQALSTNGSGVLSWATVSANTPSSADGQALGSASLEWSDLFLADASTIQFGADQDVTLTHVADTGLLLNTASVIQFRDSAINIGSPADGDLDINADDEIELNSTLVDINANADISGTLTLGGNLIVGSATVTESQLEILDGATVTTTELNLIDGGTSRGTTAVADADGLLHNDGGTMRMTSAATFKTYFQEGISQAYDDFTVGDAAVLISTTSGNITIDATASDTDIIFKGTDGSTDITPMTIDMSDSGALLLTGGTIDLKNSGSVSNIKFYCESSNAHWTALQSTAHSGYSGNVTLTLPAVTDTLVGKTTTDTLTNKTLTAPVIAEIDSGADITLDATADIVLDAAGGNVEFKDAGTLQLTIDMDGTAGAQVIKLEVDTDDLIFKQYDGTTVLTLDDDTTVKVATDLTVGDDVGLISDSAELTFGANSEIKVIHQHDSGLAIKHTATADDKPVTLTLQTGETDIAANDVIGAVNFQAPDEGAGTDAILVAAGIEAVSEGDFSSSANATSLVFKTGASEAAAGKIKVTSAGHLFPMADDSYDLGGASNQWRNIYTGDLHLSNMSKDIGNIVDGSKGDWTIQEGSSDLFLINNNSGKKYKFNLTEV